MTNRILSLAMSCAIALGMAAQYNAFPWDFPQDVKIEAEPGQWVLSCYTYYPSAVQDQKDLNDEVLIFYSTKMEQVGETTSTVGGKEMPNALIIPLDPNAKAKKGDIVLTWWQSGSGLERAIVTDASNPAEPKVIYLDMDWTGDPDHPGFADRHANETLKPGTFNILTDGEWQPGAQVAAFDGRQWLKGTLIHEQDGKVLVLGWASHIYAYKKENCRLIPFKEKLKKGDAVHATFVDGYSEGYTVKKVDEKVGRVWVDDDGREKIMSIVDVTKVLK